MLKLIKVRSFLYRHEAEMAKELLETEGVEVMISSDDHGGVRPSLAYAAGVDLLVREEDVDRASELLEQTFGDA